MAGHAPRAARLLRTENGPVAFITLDVAAGSSLAAAHELASRLEDELRRRLPDIADVVIHTSLPDVA
jgi:divalent metal cation (Fe/Co/Zn/Cd) transporter